MAGRRTCLSRHSPGTLGSAFALLLCIFLAAQSVLAAQPTEYQVKAAFLLNFTKFVEWPPSAFTDATAPLNICILRDDPFGPVLDQIVEGESVDQHKLAVRRVQDNAVSACQVLFIGNSETDAAGILATLAPGVLTVGDSEAFIRQGGIIGFVIENRRVRFDINQAAAAKESLKLSSKLLSVARNIAK